MFPIIVLVAQAHDLSVLVDKGLLSPYNALCCIKEKCGRHTLCPLFRLHCVYSYNIKENMLAFSSLCEPSCFVPTIFKTILVPSEACIFFLEHFHQDCAPVSQTHNLYHAEHRFSYDSNWGWPRC